MLWPYCSHDGIPCGGKGVSVVVALIMSLQLLREVLSSQLKEQVGRPQVSVFTKISTADSVHKVLKSATDYVKTIQYKALSALSIVSLTILLVKEWVV